MDDKLIVTNDTEWNIGHKRTEFDIVITKVELNNNTLEVGIRPTYYSVIECDKELHYGTIYYKRNGKITISLKLCVDKHDSEVVLEKFVIGSIVRYVDDPQRSFIDTINNELWLDDSKILISEYNNEQFIKIFSELYKYYDIISIIERIKSDKKLLELMSDSIHNIWHKIDDTPIDTVDILDKIIESNELLKENKQYFIRIDKMIQITK